LGIDAEVIYKEPLTGTTPVVNTDLAQLLTLVHDLKAVNLIASYIVGTPRRAMAVLNELPLRILKCQCFNERLDELVNHRLWLDLRTIALPYYVLL
jgi:hypothetical protein